MSSQRHVLLMLSCVLLVLLVRAPGTQSRPSTEETVADFAPQWVDPTRMDPTRMARGLQSVPLGHTAKFRCQAIGFPVPTLRWFKNGKKISKDQRGIKIRDSVWTLTIKSVVSPDAGNYTCVVENEHGRLEHTFQLDVVEVCYERPVLEPGLPADQTVVVGSDVTFECKVLSGTSVHMQWLKHTTVNGSRFGPDGLPYIQVLETSSSGEVEGVLTLKNVTLGDAGEYTCLVGNSVGISHQTASLTVIKPEPSNENTTIFPNVIRWAFNALFGKDRRGETGTVRSTGDTSVQT